jgi:hypothetical protein
MLAFDRDLIRGKSVLALGTIKFTAQARMRENHAMVSNQWFATQCVSPLATGKFAKMTSGKPLIFMRDSAIPPESCETPGIRGDQT